MVDDGDDDSAVDKLECDLNQLCKASPDLAPENLDADGLVDFDREVATNKSLPLPVDGIVTKTFHNLLKPLKMAAVTRMRFLTNLYYHHHEIKLMRQLKLTLFTTDLDLDPLLLKSQTKSIKEDWTE